MINLEPFFEASPKHWPGHFIPRHTQAIANHNPHLPFAERFVSWIREKWLSRLSAVEEHKNKNLIADLCKEIGEYAKTLKTTPHDLAIKAICQALEDKLSPCTTSKLKALTFKSILGLACHIDPDLFPWSPNLARAALELVSPNSHPVDDFVDLIWQPEPAKRIREFLKKILPSEQEVTYGGEQEEMTRNSSSFGNKMENIEALKFKHFFTKASTSASDGSRDKFRHGAVVFVDISLVQDVGIADELRLLDIDDLIVGVGRNTEAQTFGWKPRKMNLRWKILHAEIVALCQAVENPIVRRTLFPSVVKSDLANSGFGSKSVNSLVVSSRLESVLDKVSDGALVGSLSVLVVELDNGEVGFSSSQACPMCTKAIVRWGIGKQIYSTGEAGSILKYELVRGNNNLDAESLFGALKFFNGPSHLLLRSEEEPVAKRIRVSMND